MQNLHAQNGREKAVAFMMEESSRSCVFVSLLNKKFSLPSSKPVRDALLKAECTKICMCQMLRKLECKQYRKLETALQCSVTNFITQGSY